MELKEFTGKKVLILGLGREGMDTLKFLLKWAPGAVMAVADRNIPEQTNTQVSEAIKGSGIECQFGADYLARLDDYDLIIKSPGIPIHIPEIEKAFKAGKVTAQTQIFFDHCPGTIIGVTGTKGKSTTSSLINAVLEEAEFESHLIGNIGQAVLSFLEGATQKSIFVYELSAHQLYRLNKSPHIAVLTNLYPEHLDYYSDFNEYIQAKSNIAIHQSKNDFFIYNSEISECGNIAEQCISNTIAYNNYEWQPIGATKLKGSVNVGNMKIAAIVGRILEIEDKKIAKALLNFEPLPHRMENIGTYNGVEFYNDSLSTIQESAVAAIESLGNDLQTLIAGGYDRNQPFDKLAAAILNSSIDNLVLFLPTGQRIWDAVAALGADPAGLKRISAIKHYFVGSMDEAVSIAFKNTKEGRVCLLSAASASFGEFRDYAQRGESFRNSIVKFAGA